MFKSILNKLFEIISNRNQIRETFIHPSICRVFEIHCDPVTTTVAIPFTPARGTEKVVEYILRGISFKDPCMQDVVAQAITDLIVKRSESAKLTIPMGDYEYLIILNFERHPLW